MTGAPFNVGKLRRIERGRHDEELKSPQALPHIEGKGASPNRHQGCVMNSSKMMSPYPSFGILLQAAVRMHFGDLKWGLPEPCGQA